MAVIQEYKTPQGATIKINDQYMVPKEGNKAIIKQVSRIINGYLASPDYQQKLAMEMKQAQ